MYSIAEFRNRRKLLFPDPRTGSVQGLFDSEVVFKVFAYLSPADLLTARLLSRDGEKRLQLNRTTQYVSILAVGDHLCADNTSGAVT